MCSHRLFFVVQSSSCWAWARAIQRQNSLLKTILNSKMKLVEFRLDCFDSFSFYFALLLFSHPLLPLLFTFDMWLNFACYVNTPSSSSSTTKTFCCFRHWRINLDFVDQVWDLTIRRWLWLIYRLLYLRPQQRVRTWAEENWEWFDSLTQAINTNDEDASCRWTKIIGMGTQLATSRWQSSQWSWQWWSSQIRTSWQPPIKSLWWQRSS